jgi:hypothetical protein
MTELLCSPKIKPEHLARKAIVYLRQSSDKQVRQNLESQRLQYEVAERIRSLGWRQVEIIDCDLGSSAGMASSRREGFERVLSSVALGEVGIGSYAFYLAFDGRRGRALSRRPSAKPGIAPRNSQEELLSGLVPSTSLEKQGECLRTRSELLPLAEQVEKLETIRNAGGAPLRSPSWRTGGRSQARWRLRKVE